MTVRPVLTPVRNRSKVQHQPLPTYRYCRFGSRKKTAKMVENGDHSEVHATIRLVNCRPNRVACSTAVVYTVSPTNLPVHSATVRLVLEVFSRVIFDVTRSRMTTNLESKRASVDCFRPPSWSDITTARPTPLSPRQLGWETKFQANL